MRNLLVGGDVSREDEVVALVEQAAGGLGGLDVLVNNAGIQISRPSHELSSADFDKVPAVNLRGAFLCAREAIRPHHRPDPVRGRRPDPVPERPRAWSSE